jgi:hypothetical protein
MSLYASKTRGESCGQPDCSMMQAHGQSPPDMRTTAARRMRSHIGSLIANVDCSVRIDPPLRVPSFLRVRPRA